MTILPTTPAEADRLAEVLRQRRKAAAILDATLRAATASRHPDTTIGE